ncbi:MAG: hypothetical protein KAJ19_06505, partial [Gammaproteobacteria bacterium]|nr:hypothetical protein [Gammaproteobacteria bacterium]
EAWTDPYFQVDWRFEHSQQICKNCHIPLDRQQEHLVLGFRDKDKWDPILAPNPDFDATLQHEGVTCAVCHFRDGVILGTSGTTAAPHPVKKMDNPNQVCVHCHVVSGDRWDTFFRFPPCGTVVEIQRTQATHEDDSASSSLSGEVVVDKLADINCIDCHMPLVKQTTSDGKIKKVRRHLWRGGHNPEMVKSGLEIRLEQTPSMAEGKRRVILTLTNVGAAHYIPTGTPDRHLSVDLHLLDLNGKRVKESQHILKRTIMWRPFIIDLWDTRLPPGEPRNYSLEIPDKDGPYTVEAIVRYHLLDEKRRKRIGYENKEPIAYEVFRKRLLVI